MNKAIKNLEEYIRVDDIAIENDNSDFADFCKHHVQDIEEIIDCIKLIRDYIRDINENNFDTEKEYIMTMHYMYGIIDIIKKVLD